MREFEVRLSERAALITGGGSGIGRASALTFAREGAFVALVDRDAAGAEQTLSMLREVGGEGCMYVGGVGEARFCALDRRHHCIEARPARCADDGCWLFLWRYGRHNRSRRL